MENYLRTGQAARELGVSAHIVRKLCAAGLIEAEQTGGRQWRVPFHEVDRLKVEGLPPIPQGLEERRRSPVDRDRAGSAGSTSDGQPSDRVQDSADEVDIARNQLEKRKIEKDSALVEDFFSGRDREQQQRQADLQRQAAATEAAREQRDWLDRQIATAFAVLPRDAPEELKLNTRQSVLEALRDMGPKDSSSVTGQVVQAAVSKALRPYQRSKETQQAITEAVEELPFSAKSFVSPTPWQLKARQGAERAVSKLPQGASYEQKKATASEAVAAVSQQFVRHQEAEDHQRLCEQINKRWIVMSEVNPEDLEEAREAIRQGLARLPVGTGQRRLEAVRDQVLEPFRLKRLRQELAQVGRMTLGWEATVEDGENAEKEIAARFAALPEDADRTQLEGLRREVLEETKERVQKRKRLEERRQAVASKVRQALPHVDRYLREDYDFDSVFEQIQTARKLREEIEPRLSEELLKSDMNDEEVEAFIEDFVDDSLKGSE